jgi:phage head maturation protease
MSDTAAAVEEEPRVDEQQEIDGSLQHRCFLPEIKDLNVERRQATHLISSDAIDRAWDVLEPMGWDMKNFRRNPVVFADHRYSVFSIIGKSINQDMSPEGLYSTTQFAETPLGLDAWNLVEGGMARAWSVGFKPVQAHAVRKGLENKCAICAKIARRYRSNRDDKEALPWSMHSEKHELWEYSLVGIPANPDIVMGLVKDGTVHRENVGMLFQYAPPAWMAKHGWALNQPDMEETEEGILVPKELQPVIEQILAGTLALVDGKLVKTTPASETETPEDGSGSPESPRTVPRLGKIRRGAGIHAALLALRRQTEQRRRKVKVQRMAGDQ